MSLTLQTLEKEVSSLSKMELDEFSDWFSSFYNEQWEQKITADASSGKLNGLAANAIVAFKSGKCTSL